VHSPWRENLAQGIWRIRMATDSEAVHELRVAAARLRVWLLLGERRMLSDDLRWLRRQAGDARDLEVMLAGLPGGDEVEELRERLRRARRDLLDALSLPRAAGLLASLAVSPPIDRCAAERRARSWRDQVLRLGRRMDWTLASERELHRLRRRLRRLRFAYDWLGWPVTVLKDMTDALGDLNDLAVLRARIERGELSAGAAELPSLPARVHEQRRVLARRWPAVQQYLKEDPTR